MNLRALFDAIESSDFANRVTLESTLRRVAVNISHQELTGKLIDAVRSGRAKAEDVLSRLMQLVAENTDPRFADPRDISLTTYLFVLQQLRPDLARLGAEAVMRLPGAWWSFKFGQEISGQRWRSTSSGIVRTGQVLTQDNAEHAKTGDTIVLSSLVTSIFKHATSIPVTTSTVSSETSRSGSTEAYFQGAEANSKLQVSKTQSDQRTKEVAFLNTPGEQRLS